MKKIILVIGVVILVILLAGPVQAKTITASVTEKCRPSPVTFSVPAGQIATNFVLQDLKAGTKCGTGMFNDDYGWTIYGINVNGPIVYSLSNNVDLSGTRRKSEPYGPLNTLSLGPGTYMAYVDGGKLAYVKVNYELISVNIPSAADSGKVTPPCSNDASLLEPIMTKEYAAGPVLEAGTYKIWSGKQNSDGSIAWKATGPVQLKAKTSYVFDLPNRVLGEFNPLNVKLYPSQAVVTLKCVHEDHYSVCFEKIQSTVGPGEEWPISAGGNGHYYEAVLVPGGITWDDAKARANAAGGHLATITSAAENQFVYNLVAGDDRYWIFDSNAYGPWLGGYQPPGSPEPAGGWTWVTGESFSYTNWWTGEPNNGGSADVEESLHFIGGNTLKSPDWNDAPHDFSAKGYIIETDSDPYTLSYNSKSERTSTSTGFAGSIWKFEEYDSGRKVTYDGKWVIRQDGQTIDASWSTGHTDIIDIKSIEGDQITLYRHDTNGNYTGTISPDGMSMSGTASWYIPEDRWTATKV